MTMPDAVLDTIESAAARLADQLRDDADSVEYLSASFTKALARLSTDQDRLAAHAVVLIEHGRPVPLIPARHDAVNQAEEAKRDAPGA